MDRVCHQAAMVGHGLDPSDAPAYASHNDYGTAVLLAAMHEAGVRRLVLASSMVVYGEGHYTRHTLGAVRPGPRRAADLAAGLFDPLCTECGAPLRPGLVPESAPLEPRSTYAATKLAQEHLAAAWARGRWTVGSGRCATTTFLVVGGPIGQRLATATSYRLPVASGLALLAAGLGVGHRPRRNRHRRRHQRRADRGPSAW